MVGCSESEKMKGSWRGSDWDKAWKKGDSWIGQVKGNRIEGFRGE